MFADDIKLGGKANCKWRKSICKKDVGRLNKWVKTKHKWGSVKWFTVAGRMENQSFFFKRQIEKHKCFRRIVYKVNVHVQLATSMANSKGIAAYNKDVFTQYVYWAQQFFLTSERWILPQRKCSKNDSMRKDLVKSGYSFEI